MGRNLVKTGLAAAVAAVTIVSGLAVASDASAQSWRGYYGDRDYGGRYYGGRDHWSTGDSLALGAAIGAAVAGAPYYGGYYGRGYYAPRYYGHGYGRGYYGRGYYRPRGYAYGYGAICVRRVWDPYLGRRVRVRTYC